MNTKRIRVPRHDRSRRGTSIIELALLLPVLLFISIVILDWARVYQRAIVLTNCARQGAFYLADPAYAIEAPYQNVQEAIMAEAAGMDPPPTISTAYSQDEQGNTYVEVTAQTQFHTITNYPGIMNPIQLTRTVRMRVSPFIPH